MTTPILELEEWEASQAQPNVTVNQALRWLECFAGSSAIDRLNTPPTTPSEGDVVIVGASPTGSFATHANQVALYVNTDWQFRTSPDGKIFYLRDASTHVYYVGESTDDWISL